MQSDFWLNKWASNEIGFHRSSVNPLLTGHFAALELDPGDTLFLPLCGKTLDIHWLLEQGYNVVGVELSEKAIQALFDELRINPQITEQGPFTRYQHNGLTLYLGDFFALSSAHLPDVKAIYDRAALVALPGDMRPKYAAHLRHISGNAPQLLITYEYDQTVISGPPFSVTELEVSQLYQQFYQLNCLHSQPVTGGMKGACDATERVWLLR